VQLLVQIGTDPGRLADPIARTNCFAGTGGDAEPRSEPRSNGDSAHRDRCPDGLAGPDGHAHPNPQADGNTHHHHSDSADADADGDADSALDPKIVLAFDLRDLLDGGPERSRRHCPGREAPGGRHHDSGLLDLDDHDR
jgi:hypothetical protein